MLNLSNVLFVHSTAVHGPELEHLKKSFCGRVVLETVIAASPSLLAVYACGDVEKIVPLVPEKVFLKIVLGFFSKKKKKKKIGCYTFTGDSFRRARF